MCTHESKNCPRCQQTFECKVGSILLCQCVGVQLNEQERDYMRRQYDDCLCAACMKAVRAEYHNVLFREKVKRISGILNQ